MIGKCKAIAHGSNALEYIFREGKLGNRLAFHNLCSREPKAIYEEMKMVSDYSTRCRNKFLRIEIGIAPQEEKKLPVSELMRIAHLFVKQGIADLLYLLFCLLSRGISLCLLVFPFCL